MQFNISYVAHFYIWNAKLCIPQIIQIQPSSFNNHLGYEEGPFLISLPN